MINWPIVHVNERLVRGTGTCRVEVGVRLRKVALDANLFKHEKIDSEFRGGFSNLKLM